MIPNYSWDRFLQGFDWRQGEHVTLIGPTGQGKTTLARQLLPRRTYQLVIATKRRDPIIAALKRDGDYQVVKEFHGNTKIGTKFILDPGFDRNLRQTRGNQARIIGNAIETAIHQLGWCIYVDEGQYVCDDLKLGDECKTVWHTGRSLGVTMVMSVQRPVTIPLVAYSGATHLFFWRNTDEADLKRIGGLGGLSNKEIREAVASLPRHVVLYVNTRSGEMVTTKAKVK